MSGIEEMFAASTESKVVDETQEVTQEQATQEEPKQESVHQEEKATRKV